MIHHIPSSPPTILHIKDSSANSIGEWISNVLDVGLFLRLNETGYKNHVRTNLRIFSSLWTTLILVSLIAGIFHAFTGIPIYTITYANGSVGYENFVAFLIFFFSIWTGLFWNERRIMNNKWQYLDGLYNDLLHVGKKGEEKYKRELLRISLALNILELEMWGHRSWGVFLRFVIFEAVENQIRGKHIKKHTKSRLINGNYSKNEVRNLLYQYQYQINKKYTKFCRAS